MALQCKDDLGQIFWFSDVKVYTSSILKLFFLQTEAFSLTTEDTIGPLFLQTGSPPAHN
jgi:hypothetical protein